MMEFSMIASSPDIAKSSQPAIRENISSLRPQLHSHCCPGDPIQRAQKDPAVSAAEASTPWGSTPDLLPEFSFGEHFCRQIRVHPSKT